VKTLTKKDEWTKEEDKKLFHAHEHFAGNWQKIANEVDTNKEPGECFDRVNRVANGAKIGKWTNELDA
jgi:hypothetical protein